MGSIKDKNGMDLTEEEEIKKRWQEYTEELYKNDLKDPDNHDDVSEPRLLQLSIHRIALNSLTGYLVSFNYNNLMMFRLPSFWCKTSI